MTTLVSALSFRLRGFCSGALVACRAATFGVSPVITGASSMLGVVNTAFTGQIEASATPTSYRATSLPAGLFAQDLRLTPSLPRSPKKTP